MVRQKRIGPVLDPFGDLCIGRAAVRRVVLDPTIFRRIMRWRNDDSIGETGGSASVVVQDGMRDDRRWGEAVVLIDHDVNAIGREDFKGGYK